jgi:DNA modification methylase
MEYIYFIANKKSISKCGWSKEKVEYYLTENVKVEIGDFNKLLNKYESKFNMIYMDPPFETNRIFQVSEGDSKGFKDIWKKDEYEKWLNISLNNLKKSLVKNGILVFHISCENSYVVEKTLIKYFSSINKIFWKRCHGKNMVKKRLGSVVDIIFVCSDSSKVCFNQQFVPIDENSKWAFKHKDDRGYYSLGGLKNDRTRKGSIYTINHNGKEYYSKCGWKKSKEKVEYLINENRIHFIPRSNNMYVKVYKHEHNGKPLSNLWTDIHSITKTLKDPRLYPTQKPQKLLSRLLKLYSNEDDLILDPTCGSGTTGFVCERINRKCIMMDMNPDVLNIIKKRFKNNIF